MDKNMSVNTFAEVGKQLGCYVYVLVHPDTRKIFYVGKGTSVRVFDHVEGVKKKRNNNEPLSSKKEEIINAILDDNNEPLMYIIRYHLDDSEAFLLESALIELLNKGLFNLPQCISGEVGFEQLSNIQGGHSLDKGAISTVDDLNTKLGSIRITLNDKGQAAISGQSPINLLVAKLPSYRGVINDYNRADRTRGDWPLSKIRVNKLLKNDLYMASAEDGIITAVYKIKGVAWIPTKDKDTGKEKERARFNVDLINPKNPILQELIGKNVFFNKSQFPIIYCCE